ncbi:diguanylate cyclase [Moritella sp. 24]|uniref:GGDEF domain-containing protein n=1 Tax=Moritella sp. 24 TaxID=2746230 RepID=UPI001BAAE667|nr:GGDEF domain-containing protein [Moritella sp. 24]QUM76347.1 diguanylate cyclase [Moritella sp. 24]
MNKKLTNQELEARVKELENKAGLLQQQLDLANQITTERLKSTQLLQALVDAIPSPLYYKNTQGIFQQCNDAFAQTILGIEKEDIINKSLFDLGDSIPTELAEIYHAKDLLLLKNPGKQTYETSVKCADGSIRIFTFYKASVLDDKQQIIGIVGVMLDVSELKNKKRELKENNRRLEMCSLTDPLTGLYNRRKFSTVFPESLRVVERHNRLLNFAIIDIDNFKQFNDNYGHLAGDNALVIISNLLKNKLLRADDYIFRLGGEEFGLLFYADDDIAASRFADDIRLAVQALGIPHKANNGYGCVTISLGMVTIKHSNKDMLTLYEMADSLLYKVKETGKNQILTKLV